MDSKQFKEYVREHGVPGCGDDPVWAAKLKEMVLNSPEPAPPIMPNVEDVNVDALEEIIARLESYVNQ